MSHDGQPQIVVPGCVQIEWEHCDGKQVTVPSKHLQMRHGSLRSFATCPESIRIPWYLQFMHSGQQEPGGMTGWLK